MSTRGFIGFVVDGQRKFTYNHSDSYPSWLGKHTLAWLREAVTDLDGLRASARKLRLVDSDSTPTKADISRLRKYACTGVSTGKLTEWYVLLRDTQGDWAATLDAGVMEDCGPVWPLDDLMCEWGYAVDLDAATFTVYGRPGGGRGGYAKLDERKLASWPLADLPDDETFMATVKAADPRTH